MRCAVFTTPKTTYAPLVLGYFIRTSSGGGGGGVGGCNATMFVWRSAAARLHALFMLVERVSVHTLGVIKSAADDAAARPPDLRSANNHFQPPTPHKQLALAAHTSRACDVHEWCMFARSHRRRCERAPNLLTSERRRRRRRRTAVRTDCRPARATSGELVMRVHCWCCCADGSSQVVCTGDYLCAHFAGAVR